MNLIDAAKKTKAILHQANWPDEARTGDQPDSLEHVQWMLNGIIQGYIKDEKAHRWIGWAQAVIHIHQNVPLEVLKQFNS